MATAQSIAVPPAMIRYGDIIMLGRPVHNGDLFSRRHPKMTPQHRAKIFAPFAALAGGGNGNPLQYSCLGNPMDRGAWQATVRMVKKSHT